jgi:hypothetical protein
VDAERGVLPMDAVLPGFPGDAMAVLAEYEAVLAAARTAGGAMFLDRAAVTFVAPYRSPRKLWGSG